MENKINVAKILKNCPKGMELDCTMFDDVVFERVDSELLTWQIILRRLKSDTTFITNKYGQYYNAEDGKCVIFPKGKTTWEGFAPPHEFKDGDIVATTNGDYIFMLKKVHNKDDVYDVYNGTCYCAFIPESKKLLTKEVNWYFSRSATEEEKAELFQVIKDHGYRWNTENKALEKLIEPKFEVRNIIRNKKTGKLRTVTQVHQNCYELDDRYALVFENQDNWELAPNKFDINTLVPFESRVLARDYTNSAWLPALWGIYNDNDNSSYPYKLVGTMSRYCIPYEGNEHLLGKTDDCNNFYKTWE